MAPLGPPDAMNEPAPGQRLSTKYQALGPIAPLLGDPNVTEIMVMGARDVYVEVGGKILLTPIRFESDAELLQVIRAIVESVGRRVDEENPLGDARLPDGSRVHVAIP